MTRHLRKKALKGKEGVNLVDEFEGSYLALKLAN